MDFDFTDEQTQLADATRRWCDKAYTFDRRRAIVKAGGFDAGVWAELADLGLTGLVTDPDHGGMGMGAIDCMVVQLELGRALVMEPVAQCWMASTVLQAHAPTALQASALPGVASGQKKVAFAHQERASRYQLDSVATLATAGAGGHTLTGTKLLVPLGHQADAFIVSAQLDGQPALFWVERSAAGVRATGYITQDGSAAGDLMLQAAPATLVTRDGVAALELAHDVAIAATCAYGVGAMERLLELTVDYLNTRKQFGVAIGTFQALRHRVADVKMALELARSMSFYASLKLGAPAAERRQALSRAKVQLGQSMRLVGQQSVQLHGGIGVTDEYIASHYFKTLTQLEMTFGDTLHHLGEVAERMTDTAGAVA